MAYAGGQYQQPEQYAPIVPLGLQSQISGFETMMHGNKNDNNVMMMTYEREQYQYQQPQEYAPIVPTPLQSQDLGYENNNNVMTMTNGGEQYQYQQPQAHSNMHRLFLLLFKAKIMDLRR
ncbi:unnamed protein product [Microthlaspi erraticum]|uniref:Uncharacterized protein n=1 Tax=Microthlaspi erraticum TaxID=1685480 RepID=A0A6D2IIZ1_9BRAS|nr:unnamed protein product [Microthlaspi erraticum]